MSTTETDAFDLVDHVARPYAEAEDALLDEVDRFMDADAGGVERWEQLKALDPALGEAFRRYAAKAHTLRTFGALARKWADEDAEGDDG